jgi:hypothetical protein
MNLSDNELQYQVLVEGKVLSKHESKTLAELSLATLDESLKNKATIVPVTKSGKQFLLG